jgi:hypothetical protein
MISSGLASSVISMVEEKENRDFACAMSRAISAVSKKLGVPPPK